MGARLSQHFLTDPQVADQIIEAARIVSGTNVVEIGPGRGVLTRRLLSAGAHLTAIELDGSLFEALSREFLVEDRLRLIRMDFLKLPAAELPSPCTFVSNLPYAVATPILQRILGWNNWNRAVLMFQKEVGERILAGPGSRKYGVLSIAVALKAFVEEICEVPNTSFSPRPQVDSIVLRLKPLAQSRIPAGLSEDALMRIVQATFQHRRKKAANSIALALKLPQAAIETALTASGVGLSARAESIPVDAFTAMASQLGKLI